MPELRFYPADIQPYILVSGSRNEYSKRRISYGLELGFDWLYQRVTTKFPMWRLPRQTMPTPVVFEGECVGADKTARGICEAWGWDVVPFEAEWDKYGRRAAGPIRNGVMVDTLQGIIKSAPKVVFSVCIAFPLSGSVGTWDCAKKAARKGIHTIIIPELEKIPQFSAQQLMLMESCSRTFKEK